MYQYSISQSQVTRVSFVRSDGSNDDFRSAIFEYCSNGVGLW
jgi:hypothetical protein